MVRFALDEVPELAGAGRGVILMRPDADDRVVGALALPKDATFVARTPDDGERTIKVIGRARARRAGKGQKVVKRGGVVGLSAETSRS